MRLTLIDTLCWETFIVVWLLGAIYTRALSPATERRSDWYRQWVILLVIAVIVSLAVPYSFWSVFTFTSRWLDWIGSAVLIVSTAFILWARFSLGLMWSGQPLIKEGHSLRTTGAYAVTRHPIYTGLLGMMLGTMLEHGFGPMLPMLVLGALTLQLKIRSEEKLLTETFGEEYDVYRERVPQLIPGLKWRFAR
jgi:protein-S-isoprenylcysteine O-methyltransferase Ste14